MPMDPERWKKIDGILQAALELEAGARAAFVDQAAAGDEELRAEVMSLLSSEAEAIDLNSPAFERAATMILADQADLIEGQVIGHYRIISLLGVGGMGEVYLAEDGSLGRKVALKLLPIDFASDQTRVRNFQREARAASALNHPNIITIYETGDHEGRPFIATEYIEGETLRQRVRLGALDPRETLNIVSQVASALGAAHKAGIVHRDIKPENIMLRPDGYAKVLDFGLAKLSEEPHHSTGAQVAHNTTDSYQSQVMGTARYMSPEQASGQPLDSRSDIFSLGVVMYEMLAGSAPFKGETTNEVIASLLNDQPTNLRQVSGEISDELGQVVMMALAKDPSNRYQSVGDLITALDQLRRDSEVGQRQDGSKRRISPRARVYLALALLSLVVAGAMGLKRYWNTARSALAFKEIKISQLPDTGKARYVAVSPDGRYIAVSEVERGKGQRLLLKGVGTNETKVLVPFRDAVFNRPVFSRDGLSVFVSIWGDESAPVLHQVLVAGGESRRILEGVSSPISFSPDGLRFTFVRTLKVKSTSFNSVPVETGLFIANADGSNERLVARRSSPDAFTAGGPSWSADGEAIACAVSHEKDGANVSELNLASGKEQLLSSWKWVEMGQVAWLWDREGLLMIASEKAEGPRIWHLSRANPNGRRVSTDIANYNALSLTADFKIILASRFETQSNLWLAPQGNIDQMRQVTFGGNQVYGRVTWTPDGKILFPSNASGYRDIWISEADGTGQKRLTDDASANYFPSATSDGRYIVYSTNRSVTFNLWRMNIDGSNKVQLTHGEQETAPLASSDWVFFNAPVTGLRGLWRVPIDGGKPERFITEPCGGPGISPDGKLLACWSTPSGSTPRIAIFPMEGGQPLKIMDAHPNPDMQLRWTSDGKAFVYCVKPPNRISNMWLQPIDGGPARQLTDFKSEEIFGFDWGRDDSLIMARGFTARQVTMIRDSGR